MSPSLMTIPYEVFANIVRHINFEDAIALGRTCKSLSKYHFSDPFCRVILEVLSMFRNCHTELMWTHPCEVQSESGDSADTHQEKAPFSKEAQDAKLEGKYASALRRLAKRREAFANANPYSTAALGFATSYRYEYGVLCYTSHKQLRILDLHGSADQEYVINIPLFLIQSIFAQACDPKTMQDPCQHGTFEVLYYRDNIVSCVYKSLGLETGFLLAINLQTKTLALKHSLSSTEKIFVRHTNRFLYYGTHSDTGHDGHRRWIIYGYSFTNEKWITENGLQLLKTVGSDVASNVSFEIHDNYFYALSSQTSFEMEEIDWTSSYHCCRFPVGAPCRRFMEDTEPHSMWRRQHKEGPIDERWSTLGLEADEETGKPIIIETRREWRDGASRSQRTYYRTELVFSPYKEYNISRGTAGSSSSYPIQALPTNDPLVRVLTSSDKPLWREAPPRFPRNEHKGDDGVTSSSRAFTFPKTKIRGYNCSANAFLDVVDDPSADDWQEKQRLRLRIGSRTLNAPARYSAEHARAGQVEDTKTHPETGELCAELNESYTLNPLKMWPPDSPDYKAIYQILNPEGHLGEVEGTSDNRSVVYTTGGGQCPPAIVFISFDPSIKLQGLQEWSGKKGWKLGAGEGPHIDGRASGGYPDGMSRDSKGKSTEKEVLLQDRLTEAARTANNLRQGDVASPEWLWREAALYTKISKGLWTRH